jgi:pimeloyl-ACP methyl ester carboxylesterase
VVGHSLGAALAQCLARAQPERVRGLALANFGLFTPLRARLLARTLRLVIGLPEAVRARLVAGQVRRLVPDGPGRTFWASYLGETELAQAKALGDQFRLLGDLLRQPPFGREELARWKGKVLLLESEEDSAFEPEEQMALRALHPQATVHVFGGANHLSWVEQPDAFAGEIRALIG